MVQRHKDHKRDKQKKQTNKKHPFFPLAVWQQIATKLGMWIEHVRTIFGPILTFCVQPAVSELGGSKNLGAK